MVCFCDSVAEFGITRDVLSRDIELVLRRNHIPIFDDAAAAELRSRSAEAFKKRVGTLSAQIDDCLAASCVQQAKDNLEQLRAEMNRVVKDKRDIGSFIVNVDAIKSTTPTLYGFSISASFEELATVDDTGDHVMADVWNDYPSASLYGTSRLPEVRDAVKDIAERFALDYLRANPQ